MVLEKGDKAPDFLLDSSDGTEVSLRNYLGKKVVLYFYPKDSTPGCTLEARDFESLKAQFLEHNALIFGVSRDSINSHHTFAAKECLSFPLLSDESGAVCEAYGVWIEKSMYGKKYMGVSRDTFLIDEAGIIEKVWRGVRVNGHAAAILDYVKNKEA